VVGAASWLLTPQLAEQRNGDQHLLARLSALEGYQDLSVAVVDLDASQHARFANIGSSQTTPFEAGSLTKALTGLVIADAVRRGELDLDGSVSAYLPVRDRPPATSPCTSWSRTPPATPATIVRPSGGPSGSNRSD
jgi:CubicO group peptidase (beta-lactamase class C family)